MSSSDLNMSEAVDSDTDFGALSKEELDELQKVNAETIADLEKDIKLLQRKLNQFGNSAVPKKEFQVLHRADGSSNVADVESKLEREIETYTVRLKETMRLTGITIENIHRQVLELDDSQCKKQFSLELQLLNRRIHLTYTIVETLDNTEPQGGRVSWFEIKFEEDLNEAVGADVAKAADELAIHSVFSLLKSCLQWQTGMEEAVRKFKDQYPGNVSKFTNKGGNQCLRISNPKSDHPVFIVEWGRKTVDARVEPDIKLNVRAPQELLAMDSKNILDSAPEMLQKMIASLGVYQALDSLIQLVATDGKITQQQPQLQQQELLQQQEDQQQHQGEEMVV